MTDVIKLILIFIVVRIIIFYIIDGILKILFHLPIVSIHSQYVTVISRVACGDTYIGYASCRRTAGREKAAYHQNQYDHYQGNSNFLRMFLNELCYFPGNILSLIHKALGQVSNLVGSLLGTPFVSSFLHLTPDDLLLKLS